MINTLLVTHDKLDPVALIDTYKLTYHGTVMRVIPVYFTISQIGAPSEYDSSK